ncbi:MAG: STAS domain-containing protein [Spirochaetes bacterium]|jgi:anti-anti-sigma regulatory factor|nr:STAS domain-containing protein [Spirochaetota bacterium]
MEITQNVWKFSENVDFAMAHICLSRFKSISHNQTITIDLSGTEHVHSSFIGFLIHASQTLKKEGGDMVLSISPTLEKIFLMLKILNYFPQVSVKDPLTNTAAESMLN